MENLQYEVLELEYQEYAKGHETITEVDFAQILLRYTQLDGEVYDMYLERLLDRVKDQQQGITFQVSLLAKLYQNVCCHFLFLYI